LHYLYLDESGDLGFDLVNKKSSKFFTVCILLIKGEENKKKIIKSVKRTLRKKLNPKNKRNRIVQELKGTSTTLEVKKYFFKKVKDLDFYIYSVTLNKIRVYDYLVKNKSRVYNWIVRLLLDEIDFSEIKDRIFLIIDKSKSKPQIVEFNKYIYRQLMAKIDPIIPLEIKHKDSCSDYGLNAVDLFSWGIFRKHERNDWEWYNIFKGKIKFDNVYLP
jgi:hypothetical protein